MQIYSPKNKFIFSGAHAREDKNLLLAVIFLFTLPLLPLNQLIVGTIVNAVLINSAINFKSKKVFILSIIPSTAVLLGGVLFANITLQIALMLPFIWAGNFVLMFLTRKLFAEQKKNYFVSTLISSIVKTAVLFSAAFALFNFGAVPVLFLTMFGAMQLITAESGAVIAHFLFTLNKKID